MSDAIKRMLADRDRANDAREGARRRAIIEPFKKQFLAGFNLMRRKDEELEPLTLAFKEGVESGMMDAGCPPEIAWNISEARKVAMAKAEKQ